MGPPRSEVTTTSYLVAPRVASLGAGRRLCLPSKQLSHASGEPEMRGTPTATPFEPIERRLCWLKWPIRQCHRRPTSGETTAQMGNLRGVVNNVAVRPSALISNSLAYNLIWHFVCKALLFVKYKNQSFLSHTKMRLSVGPGT